MEAFFSAIGPPMRRRGWMAPLLGVLTAIAALGFSFIRMDIWPVYESSVDVLVQPESPALVGAAQALLNSYEGWLNSNQRALSVIDRIDLDSHPDVLMGNVEFETDEGQLMITIIYEGRNPEVGEAIVEEWAQLLVEWRELENQDTLIEDGRIDAIIIDAPTSKMANPLIWANAIAGLVFGTIIGIAVVYLVDNADADLIRYPEDITEGIVLELQGQIPSYEIESEHS